jgi:hypothetical protein
MKQSSTTNLLKWFIAGFMVLLAISVTLRQTEVLAAQPPQQEGDQPTFTGSVQSAEDGSASIISQEALLDLAYLTTHGELSGLSPGVAGLALDGSASEGSYTSPAIHSPLDFTTDLVLLWGADLPAQTALRLETRLSLDGGANWSDWLENPEAFYPVRDDLHSGDLIWANSDQTVIQFRVILRSEAAGVSPLLKSVVLAFNDTSQGPTDGEIAGAMAEVSAANGLTCPVQKPGIITRKQWGCPNMWYPRRPPVYAPVTHIILHQTETPNSPHPYQGYAGWVRSIWNFHANILRWGDVGYNYLIDPNGLIYEGRAGGDDVIGIHDGINAGSMGIGFIGCYGNCDNPWLTVAEPSEAMLNSAVELMAWKVRQRGLDPLGRSDYRWLDDVPVIAGGRDVSMTTSPGDNIYNKLEELRQRVDARVKCDRQPCQITAVIFGQESYQVGETIEFTVRLADFQGMPLPGATVTGTVEISETAQSQASTGFGLEDRVGEYDGSFLAQGPGLYTFTFFASDPTNQRFTPCMGTETIRVEGSTPTSTPTATPTPTSTPTPTTTPPTPTPTDTPTATPSPTPTSTPPVGTLVRVAPQNQTICTGQGTSSVEVVNVTDLAAVQLELVYDPNILQVVDADPGRDGVQIRVGDVFSGGFVAQNTVDTVNGRIFFAATLLGGDNIDGDAELIAVDWQSVAPGTSALSLEDVILVRSDSQVIQFTSQNGTVQVTASCAGVTGVLNLQGRDDHSGIVVSSAAGQQTQTQADGSFTIDSQEVLSFSFPGYLSAEADIQSHSAQNLETGQPAFLGQMTLLAGDVNNDNLIDILDLAYVAGQYDTGDALADLNGDGQVDILDLVLAAGNYGRSGPLVDWR